MDNAAKRLRIPALFPFILSPLFAWESVIAGACVHRVRFRETKKRARFFLIARKRVFFAARCHRTIARIGDLSLELRTIGKQFNYTIPNDTR